MTRNFVFATALLLTFCNSPTSFAKSVESKISEVTIFQEGALITREALVSLGPGDQELEIDGLPKYLDASDVRVKFSNSDLVLGQVATKLRRSNEQDDKIEKLEKRIEALKLQLQVERDIINSAKLQLKYLESLAAGIGKQSATNSSLGSVNTEGWRQTMELMKSGSQEVYEAIRLANQRSSKLSNDLKAATADLKQSNDRSSANTGLVITVRSPSSLQSMLSIQYQEEETTWSSSYEARLDTGTGKLKLTQIALVEQQTSEDWNNVSLTLSTSMPNQSVEPPSISSEFWTLSDRVKESFVDYAPASAPRARNQAQLQEIVVTAAKRTSPSWEGDYAMSFPIPGKVNVPNDFDNTQRFELVTHEFDTSTLTSIVPKKDTTAYLGVRFTPGDIAPLYSSELQIFVDGTFSGVAEMPDIFPNKEVTLPMGQDPRIEVRVIDKGGKNKEGGVISKQKTQSEDLVFEIVNRRRNAAEIEVRAAVPVSKHRSLKVTVHEETTEPTEANEDDQTGLMLWRKRVNSGDTWKINYKVSMSHPSDRNLRRSY